MSEAEKPVDCVCGQHVEAFTDEPWVKMGSTTWEVICPNRKCLRRGPLGRSKRASVRLWNRDMRAIKHFPAVVEELEKQQKQCQSMGVDIPDCDTCKRRFEKKDCTLPRTLKTVEEQA